MMHTYDIETIPQQSLALPVRTLTPDIWHMINEIAPVMFKSRLFGITSLEQGEAIMLKGYELGLSITASFELVQVVQGKPGLSPRGALALLHNSTEIEKIEIRRLTNGEDQFVGYECVMKRKNGFEHTEKFTLEDAKTAGLIKPGSGWESYPENMCKWRAIGFCADVVAPDIVAGMTTMMKMPEQLGIDIDNDGNMIDSEIIDQKVITFASSSQENILVTMDDLLCQFGAESIINANDGRIPGTDEEVMKVYSLLSGGG